MQKPLLAVLVASAMFSLNTQAADLVQVYKQALANDATYASARAALNQLVNHNDHRFIAFD